jgi:molecular chaperone HscB
VDVAFETNTAMPREFLMEQMELREKLEQAKTAADLDMIAGNLSVARREIENQIREKIDGKRDFAAAKDLVRKLMFLERFGEDVGAAYEALEA